MKTLMQFVNEYVKPYDPNVDKEQEKFWSDLVKLFQKEGFKYVRGQSHQEPVANFFYPDSKGWEINAFETDRSTDIEYLVSFKKDDFRLKSKPNLAGVKNAIKEIKSRIDKSEAIKDEGDVLDVMNILDQALTVFDKAYGQPLARSIGKQVTEIGHMIKAAKDLERSKFRDLKTMGKELGDVGYELQRYMKMFAKDKKWKNSEDEEEYESLMDFIVDLLNDAVSNLEDWTDAGMFEAKLQELNLPLKKGKSNDLNVRLALQIAKKYAGDLTKAVKMIEKLRKGLSDDPEVANALRQYNESIFEGKKDYKIYHRLYSDAVGEALALAKKQGYEVDEDEVFRSITSGPRKPSEGKTNSFKLSLTQNGKPVKRMLVFQVYGMKNQYELTAYVS